MDLNIDFFAIAVFENASDSNTMVPNMKMMMCGSFMVSQRRIYGDGGGGG